jgi:hypothetical protein
MCVDIEIRRIETRDGQTIRVVIFDIEGSQSDSPIRSVKDIYQSNDFLTAIESLKGYLLGRQYLRDNPRREINVGVPDILKELEFVEECHDVSNLAGRNHRGWLHSLTVHVRVLLRKLLEDGL